MAAADLLDLQKLTAPIPGENPAGGDVPFELKQKLEGFRKEENPEDYRADDPLRPKVAKKADWSSIEKLTKEILTATSKDLQTAARLTEALVRQHGFPGLREGLKLLRTLTEQCWDRLNPPLEPDDPEVRAGPFEWLDDADKGARFPYTLRCTPLWTGTTPAYAYNDWEGKGAVSRDEFEKALAAATHPGCQTVAEAIVQSRAELDGLSKALTAKLAAGAPGLTSLREALQKCHEVSQSITQKKAPAAPVAAAAPTKDGQPAPAAATPAVTRESLLAQVSRAAEELRKLEPHSPIPYLIQRAVEIGRLPFPDMIKEFVRDGNMLKELNRELGIKEAAAPKK